MFIFLNVYFLCEKVSFSLTFSCGAEYKKEEKEKKRKKKEILFKIAKTNIEMPSVLSNILGCPGGNSSQQVRLIHMHTSRNDSVTLLNQHKHVVVCRQLRPISD